MGDRVFKSKVLLKITNLVKEKDEDGNEILRVVDDSCETVSGRELFKSCMENRNTNPTEIVYARPQEFKFGVLYVLADGKRAWVFNLKE